MTTIDTLKCDVCGAESGSKSSRPIRAFGCLACSKGTMWREGHGPDYLWTEQ